MDPTIALIADIESYCQQTGMAESTFGRLAVNDGKLVSRLRKGKGITVRTTQRIQSFMRTKPRTDVSDGDKNTRPEKPFRQNAQRPARKLGAKKKARTGSRPFRFYDNRQKYLAFVTTCDEKFRIAERAGRELRHLRPRPPAMRLFDAGMGDGTVLTVLMRDMHRKFPTVPFFLVGKEISLEDVRLSLEKMPDRFFEHPATVLVITNLYYAEAPWLMPADVKKAAALNWQEIPLAGTCSHEYSEQIKALNKMLVEGWQVKSSERTGNPLYVRPSVLVLYREDHKFLLDDIIPRPGQNHGMYDLVLASQPWRARMSAQFKAQKVLAPLTRSLGAKGRLIAVQSYGRDPGLEIVQRVWPDENPFIVNRHELLAELKKELGPMARDFSFNALSDKKSIFRHHMHTLPTEISESIGTSTLFAAWNAAIYVAQIEDDRLAKAISSGAYLEATSEVLRKHGGLWFNDETFVVARH